LRVKDRKIDRIRKVKAGAKQAGTAPKQAENVEKRGFT
jgi:hypothetical protein